MCSGPPDHWPEMIWAGAKRVNDSLGVDYIPGTTRECDESLIHQPTQRRAQFVGLKTEWAWFGFVGDTTPGIDYVKTVGPARVGLFGRVAECIDQGGDLDSEFSYTRSRD